LSFGYEIPDLVVKLLYQQIQGSLCLIASLINSIALRQEKLSLLSDLKIVEFVLLAKGDCGGLGPTRDLEARPCLSRNDKLPVNLDLRKYASYFDQHLIMLDLSMNHIGAPSGL
jgi:hypothetical protein